MRRSCIVWLSVSVTNIYLTSQITSAYEKTIPNSRIKLSNNGGKAKLAVARQLEDVIDRHDHDASEREGENPATLPYYTSPPTKSPSAQPSSTPTQPPTNTPSFTPSASPSSKPSSSPTFAPSFTPSVGPSNVPSSSPSLGPTFTPSSEPSNLPSSSHSLEPSFTPSFKPSSAPSYEPSTSPSSFPTSIPSPVPSSIPSSSPTLTPSVSPSQTPICTIDESGNFGITDSTTTESSFFASTIVYAYEIETSNGVSGADVVGLVENALGDEILATMWEACPSSPTRRSRRRKLEEPLDGEEEVTTDDGVIGDLIGFSSSPADQVDDVGCENAPPSGNECTFITGRFTIYTRSSPEDGSTFLLKNEALEGVKSAMAEGNEALYVNDSIEKITYVDPNSRRPAVDMITIGETDNGAGGGGFNRAWVIAPAAVAGVAALFLVVARRAKSSRGQYMYEDVDEKERGFVGKYDMREVTGVSSDIEASGFTGDDASHTESGYSHREKMFYGIDLDGNVEMNDI